MEGMKVRLLKVHGEDLEDSNLEDKQIQIQYELIRLCYYNNIFII